jgi:hypothetical protein
LVELQQACPLLLDGHVLWVVVKLGKPAQRLRLALPPGWLSFRAEAGRRVRRACLCLAQMVKRLSVVPVALVSLRAAALLLLPVAWLLHLAASVLPPAGHEPVCLLDPVKLAARRPRLEPLDSRQLLAVDFRLPARRRQLVEERSWDSQS